MTDSFLSRSELQELGFRNFGENVLVSRKASIYSPGEISLGSNVRIDDFCILSGKISVGSFVHISAYTALYGKFGIVLEDYVTVSGNVLIYSQSDDYSGRFMTNPMLPEGFSNVTGGQVTLKKHAIVAAGCIVFPGITLHEGAAAGAMSLVNKDIPEWSVYAGIPAKFIKERHRDIIELEKRLSQTLR
ncbi:MAG: acyltransferase [Bacteroidota bacterium]